jgi:peptidoglycan/LPS O-acetylase OafA/YrhL
MGGGNDLTRSCTEWLQNITLTQWLTLLHHPETYAAQNPTLFVTAYWSLNYEEQFYILFGLMMLLASVGPLRIQNAVATLITISIAWLVYFPTLCYGLFIEYWAMFGMGALVFYRLCRLHTALHRCLADLMIVGTLVLSVFMRIVSARGNLPISWNDWIQPATRVAWGDLAVCSAFALLLVVIRPFNAWYVRSRWLSIPLGSLGLISYSLYLVHQFNLNLADAIAIRTLHLARINDSSILLNGSLQSLILVGIAVAFWYFCERPFLNRSLLPTSGVPTNNRKKQS